MSLNRKILAFVLALVLLLPVGTIYGEQQSQSIEVYYAPIHFVVDGKEMAPPESQQGFIYQGNTYVPLRFISYSLNKAVEWSGDTYTVTLKEPTDKEKSTIAEYNLNRFVRESQIKKFDAAQLKPTSLEVYFEQVTYLFDGQKKQPSKELPGMIYDGSLYVPLRFFSESVGKQIDWDSETYTVVAKSVKVESKPEEKPATDKPSTDKPATDKPGSGTPSGGAGGSIGGGGGGGVISKPSYESLKADADAKISALRDEAQAYFYGLLEQYKEADAKKRAQLKQAGATQLATFDNRFNSLISDFESKLASNQYSLAIITEYKQEYENQKAIAKAIVQPE